MRILFVNKNNCKNMIIWNIARLSCMTIASLIIEFNDIFMKNFSWLNFIYYIYSLNIMILLSAIVDCSLNLSNNLWNNQILCIFVDISTCNESFHWLMMNIFKYRKNWHFSCFKKSWIERFYNIKSKILIISFKKIELSLIFR